MCDVADESWDVFNCDRVKARKQHECVACPEPIERGHFYMRTFAVHSGSVSTWKHCLRCHVMYERLCREHNRNSDPIWVDERLNCGTSYEDAFGESPPDDIAALAFLTPAEAQAQLGKAAP